MTSVVCHSLYDGGTVELWLVAPNLVFTRVLSAVYTVAQAETFVGPIWSRAQERLGAKRYIWVSDSRAISRYEMGSRLQLTRWTLDHRAELERLVLLVSPQHRLVAAGIHVGCLASVAVGTPAYVETSPDALLHRHGIAWPGGL